MRLGQAVSLVGGGRLGAGLSNAYDSNVYLVHDDGGCWMVDAGSGLEPHRLMASAREAAGSVPIVGVALTHAHADHAGGTANLAEHGITAWAGEHTAQLVRDGDPTRLGLDSAIRAGIYPEDFVFAPSAVATIKSETIPGAPTGFSVVPSPGHSADHTIYLLTREETTYAFTGDLVFSRGRVAVLGTSDTDIAQLHASIEGLHQLSPDVLLPGHGSPVLHDATWHLEQALRAFELGQLPQNFN